MYEHPVGKRHSAEADLVVLLGWMSLVRFGA
jgi:hypothetical protein